MVAIGSKHIYSVTYYPKDFIQTADGLVFAVVATGLEDGKVLSFLRYRQTATGWQKFDTTTANAFLALHTPDYRYYSTLRDTVCHAVPLANITQHFQPRQRLQHLLLTPTAHPILKTCVYLLRLLQQHGLALHAVGITGSLLLGAQQPSSDIDLVFYERPAFNQARQLVQDLIAQNVLQSLTTKDWLEAYQRRESALDFAGYVWHEQRKGNKAMVNGRKVDFSLVATDTPIENRPFEKAGAVVRVLKVLDDSLAYDYPAEFKVDAADIERVVCFTATYTGQAITGEWIEVAGQLEVAANGLQRIVVGASREAPGEYIKVVQHHD
ncbi:MAG: hypothetical protein HOP02_00115 [Methylococcaceae bacterium]|nr:hypothetical protein [Methylococcaceae bacterium]